MFAVRNYYKWSFTALNLINCREITAMKSGQYKLCMKQLKEQLEFQLFCLDHDLFIS